MSDELDARLRTALQAEIGELPFAVTRQMVEDRLAQQSRRPGMLLAVTGLAALALFAIAALIVSPGVLPPSGRAGNALALNSDACALVSDDEVERATGSHVTSSRLARPEEVMNPDEPLRPCVFRTDGFHGQISVVVDTNGADDFARWRDANRGMNLIPLVGLGDEAYSYAGAILRVRVGNGYFQISSQLGAGDPRSVADLAELARSAVEKAGGVAAEPTWVPAPSGIRAGPEVGSCAVTRPTPAFVAPSPYPAFPPIENKAWIGTPELWTMLPLDGEVVDAANTAVPVGIKTFWWSSSWEGMRADSEPAITIVATQLDGPGEVTSDGATNAAADSLGGEAMLVGIELPTPGCWEMSAEYRGATLSYVLWVTGPRPNGEP